MMEPDARRSSKFSTRRILASNPEQFSSDPIRSLFADGDGVQLRKRYCFQRRPFVENNIMLTNQPTVGTLEDISGSRLFFDLSYTFVREFLESLLIFKPSLIVDEQIIQVETRSSERRIMLESSPEAIPSDIEVPSRRHYSFRCRRL
jgi:hypothetical protein